MICLTKCNSDVNIDPIHNLDPPNYHLGMASRLLAGSRSVERVLSRIPSASTSSNTPIQPVVVHHAPSRTRDDPIPSKTSQGRALSTSTLRHDYHFDTHHFVQRLEKEGLTRAQAEGIMNSMAEVIDESIRTMTRNMVTKSEQEKVCAN